MKIKNRLEVIIRIYAEHGELMTEMRKPNATPQEALRDSKNLREGDFLDLSPGVSELRAKGYTGSLNQGGVIGKKTISVIFRKR